MGMLDQGDFLLSTNHLNFEADAFGLKLQNPALSDAEAQRQAITAEIDAWSRTKQHGFQPSDINRMRNARAINELDRKEKEKNLNALTRGERFKRGFGEAISEGTVDARKAFWHAREMRGQDPEAPRLSQILGVNPTFTRARELLSEVNFLPDNIGPISIKAKPEDIEAREKAGLGLHKDGYARAGQLLGTVGGDIIQDRGRNLYWLLNAPQAVANVTQEVGLAKVAPELYQSEMVLGDNGKPIELASENYPELVRRNLIGLNEQGNEIIKGGVNRVTRGDKTYLTKRRYRPGSVDALAIPTGVAINAGVGMLNPFGGGNGYSAVFESEDDPTKSSNVIGEVAAKYIMGRTGNLLNWDEFKKVRPDVSKDEYMRYKAFKYDKETDMDLSDGDFTLALGALKGTTEGIHGPEIQMLGRSIPIATALMPTVAAGIGTAMGARWEPKEFDGWRDARKQASRLQKEEGARIQQKGLNEENKRLMRTVGNKEIGSWKEADWNALGEAKQRRFRKINRVRNGLYGGLGAYAGSLALGLGIENERRRRNQAENERQQSQL